MYIDYHFFRHLLEELFNIMEKMVVHKDRDERHGAPLHTNTSEMAWGEGLAATGTVQTVENKEGQISLVVERAFGFDISEV